VVGLGAALIEGAPVATLDLDLWLERIDDPRIPQAAAEAGGFWVAGFGLQPPSFGGQALDRLDVVLTLHGLGTFDDEYARSLERVIDGLPLRVLPLDRVVASKRATNRLKTEPSSPCSKQYCWPAAAPTGERHAGEITARFSGVAPTTARSGMLASNVANRPPMRVASASR
jgi:hypothetical protein